MKKHYYETPKCEIVRLTLENTVLFSSGFGEEGEAGDAMDFLDPIGFGAPIFDGLL